MAIFPQGRRLRLEPRMVPIGFNVALIGLNDGTTARCRRHPGAREHSLLWTGYHGAALLCLVILSANASH